MSYLHFDKTLMINLRNLYQGRFSGRTNQELIIVQRL